MTERRESTEKREAGLREQTAPVAKEFFQQQPTEEDTLLAKTTQAARDGAKEQQIDTVETDKVGGEKDKEPFSKYEFDLFRDLSIDLCQRLSHDGILPSNSIAK